VKRAASGSCLAIALVLFSLAAQADKYDDAIAAFRGAGASAAYFDKCYGYAVLPNIGEGAFGVGGARGRGRVYVRDQYVGDTTMTQVSLGFQVGIQAYRQIIFFEDERAFREFTSGSFEFGAEMSMAFVRAGASAAAGSSGATAAVGAAGSGTTAGGYHKGMAVFAVPKGGGMVELSIGGQKYSYRSRPEAAPPVTQD
jgi:lipid-binding SYLF domain-containing protein